jgi:hypothetical protein
VNEKMSKTETYIILKPISERFNRISKEITDDEIRIIIKDTIRKQLKEGINFYKLQELIENYIDDQDSNIKTILMDSIRKRL